MEDAMTPWNRDATDQDYLAAAKRPFWYCNACGAQNHEIDGECQYCACEGHECKRDNCSDPAHFCPDTEDHQFCNSRRTCRITVMP